MEKVLKRVTHKKQNPNSAAKSKDGQRSARSSINKRYSVDDNFYTYVNRGELYQNCSGTSYYTIASRGDLKRNPMHRSRCVKQELEGEKLTREDVTFKKFLKVFNSSENSRGAKDWFTSSASNMMDFAPKILTKRFCGKKGDNELYRSNSFKFERFERKDADTLTSSKKSPVSRQVRLIHILHVRTRPVYRFFSRLCSRSLYNFPFSTQMYRRSSVTAYLCDLIVRRLKVYCLQS